MKQLTPTHTTTANVSQHTGAGKNGISFQKKVENFPHEPIIQAKLKIGSPNNPDEKEADRIASHIMQNMELGEISTQETEEIQLKKNSAQRKPSSGNTSSAIDAPQGLKQQLNSSKGQGNPLPSEFRNKMERALDTDLSEVRIHNNDRAAKMSESVQAKAFTTGSDVYFNKGEYNPNSYSGKHLLAHEMTHVVQQRSSEQMISRQDQTNKSQLSENDKRLKIQGLRNQLSRHRSKIDTNGDFWIAFFLNVANSYIKAVETHKAVIKAQNQVDAERAAVVMAAMSAISVGALSYGSTILQNKDGLKKFFSKWSKEEINAIEDFSQTATDKVLTTNVYSRTSPKANELPAIFQNTILAAAFQTVGNAKKLLDNVIEIVDLNNTPENYEDLLSSTQQVIAIIQNSQLMAPPPKVDFDKLRISYERFIWANWILKNSTREVLIERTKSIKKHGIQSGVQYRFHIVKEPRTEYIPPGSEVQKRFSAGEINITNESGVGDFGWDGDWGWITSHEEVKKLIKWAENYINNPDVVIPKIKS